MPNKKLLITRPNHDTTTHYLCEWSQRIIDLAIEKNVDVTDLRSERATADNVFSYLSGAKYHFVILNGHGNATQVAGHQDDVIIEADKNHEALKDKIVYSITCSSAKELGKRWDGTNTAYIGYEEDFALIYNKNMVSRPTQDEYAKLILEPTLQISSAILKGQNVGEAKKRAIEAYQKNIFTLQNSESFVGSENLVMALIMNSAILSVHGNEDARL